MESNRSDIYERVTTQILQAVERGAGSCQMPWHRTGGDTFTPINAQSKKPYRGVNVVSLWVAAEYYGYTSGIWGTYKQWSDLGAQVRKGEKSAKKGRRPTAKARNALWRAATVSLMLLRWTVTSRRR